MVKSVQDQRAKEKDTLTGALHLNWGERVGERAGWGLRGDREKGGGRSRGGARERGRSWKTLKGVVPSGWWRWKFQGLKRGPNGWI